MTRAAIAAAIDWEIADWRERQIDAIRDVAFPLLSATDDETIKTLTAFNSAYGAVSTFGGSALIPHDSVAKFVLGGVTSALSRRYQQTINAANRRMSDRYTRYRDELIREIQDSARVFTGSQTGQRLVAAIERDVPCPAGVDTDERLQAFYREVLHQSGAISTDPTALRQQAREGFGTLLSSIRSMFLASHHAPLFSSESNRAFLYSENGDRLPVRPNPGHIYRPTRAEWARWEAQGARSWSRRGVIRFRGFIRVRDDAMQDQVLRRAWQMRVKDIQAVSAYHREVWISRHVHDDIVDNQPLEIPDGRAWHRAFLRATEVLRRRGVISG